MLALTLGGSKRFPGLKQLIAFAQQHCDIQPAAATSILESIAEDALTTMGDVRAHIEEFPDFRPVGDAMISAWTAGIDSSCHLDRNKTVF